MSQPVSFDRAADIYDQTRGFPPGVAEQVAASAAGRLRPEDRLLEIGVGTGRIARPLLARGFRLTGLDVSHEMVARLRAQLPAGSSGPDLVLADATRIALAASCFNVVISVHIFHLIPDWRRALAEIQRVLVSGGALLQGYNHRPDDSPFARLRERWGQLAAEYGARGVHVGLLDFSQFEAALLEMGGSVEKWTAAAWSVERSLNEQIQLIEQRAWSSTWEIPDAIFQTCALRLHDWALQQYGDLDRPISVPQSFVWEMYRFSN